MAFCKYCGSKLEDGAKFCPKCGKSTSEEDEKSQKEKVQEEARSSKSGCMKKLLYGFIALCVIGYIGNKFGGGDSNATDDANAPQGIEQIVNDNDPNKEWYEKAYRLGYENGQFAKKGESVSFNAELVIGRPQKDWSQEEIMLANDCSPYYDRGFNDGLKNPKSEAEKQEYKAKKEKERLAKEDAERRANEAERQAAEEKAQKEAENKKAEVAKAGYDKGYEKGFQGYKYDMQMYESTVKICYSAKYGTPMNEVDKELFKIYSDNFWKGYQEGKKN